MPRRDGFEINGQQSVFIPAGETAIRPTDPETGAFRFNTDLDALEVFNGRVWNKIGSAKVGYSQVKHGDILPRTITTASSGQQIIELGYPIDISLGEELWSKQFKLGSSNLDKTSVKIDFTVNLEGIIGSLNVTPEVVFIEKYIILVIFRNNTPIHTLAHGLPHTPHDYNPGGTLHNDPQIITVNYSDDEPETDVIYSCRFSIIYKAYDAMGAVVYSNYTSLHPGSIGILPMIWRINQYMPNTLYNTTEMRTTRFFLSEFTEEDY